MIKCHYQGLGRLAIRLELGPLVFKARAPPFMPIQVTPLLPCGTL